MGFPETLQSSRSPSHARIDRLDIFFIPLFTATSGHFGTEFKITNFLSHCHENHVGTVDSTVRRNMLVSIPNSSAFKSYGQHENGEISTKTYGIRTSILQTSSSGRPQSINTNSSEIQTGWVHHIDGRAGACFLGGGLCPDFVSIIHIFRLLYLF